MPHSFVVARLLPQLSARWTGWYGWQMAAKLRTQPFLALRVVGDYTEEPYNTGGRGITLFVVSPEKPVGINRGCYLTLGSGAQSLIANPPFPSDGKPLYVHTFPKLLEYDRPLDPPPTGDVPTSLPNKLDGPSFDILRRAAVKHQEDRMQLHRTELGSSGGNEPIETDWDTWSGQADTDTQMHDPHSYHYEYTALPPDFSFSNPPAIVQDYLLYKQLSADFTSVGISSCITWVRKTREYQREHLSLVHNLEQTPPKPVTPSHASLQLGAMRIPYDGDPPPPHDSKEDEGELQLDWDDEPVPQFERSPLPRTTANSGVDVKVVVFDLIGTVLDREHAICDSLSRLSSHFQITHTLQHLVTMYIAFEGHEYADHPELESREIARRVLQKIGDHFGLCVGTQEAESILEPVLSLPLPLYEDVTPALEALTASGYTLFGLSSAAINQPLPPGLASIPESEVSSHPYSRIPEDMSCLEDYLRSLHPGIKSEQILLVSASQYRVTERANMAGFPTILMRRPGALLSSININAAPPTLIVQDLLSISKKLAEASSISPAPYTDEHDPGMINPYRIRELYQVYSCLGAGRYGAVVNAFHLSTGEEVAIKEEMPTGEADEICLLPYEAQIYRHLAGYRGIPTLRWYGMDGGAHIMVIDKLGPTINQLRRFCRRKFSLRTVVTLAIDILERVEYIHSRGIILRDINPDNFAMGVGQNSNTLYSFDFGLAKLYRDPATGAHIPYREGRDGLGTPRFSGHNVHLGLEQGRRDDMEGVGNMLLFLLHGRLPWQGIYAASIPDKMKRLGEMKRGQAFQNLLDNSPPEFNAYSKHCRSLAFDEEPDYDYLKRLFRKRKEAEGWVERKFDWMIGAASENGTLMDGEYRFDLKFVNVELQW